MNMPPIPESLRRNPESPFHIKSETGAGAATIGERKKRQKVELPTKIDSHEINELSLSELIDYAEALDLEIAGFGKRLLLRRAIRAEIRRKA